ncbi:MAG: Xaa-Pro peptidase family protein [bacterium]
MSRISRLREVLHRHDLNHFIVTHLPNIRYLCGFSGTAGFLLITPRKTRLFTDFRYQEQASQQVHDAEVVAYRDDLIKELKRRSLKLADRIGFEAQSLDVAAYQAFQAVLGPSLVWIPTEKMLEKVAAVKEPLEIEKHRRAAQITDAVFADLLKLIAPGVCELDISTEISYLHKKKGASGDAFPSIVASGVRSALPHGIASEKIIEKGDLVTIDMGCVYDGYTSDLTRTVVAGKASQKAATIYSIVLEAQCSAIAAARPGMKAKELDGVARGIIQEAGYGDYFGHGLGHGLGIEVHAEPRLNVQSLDILQPGHVFTIEPGIYLPDFGGVRIEDDVCLTASGCEVLTKSPKDLIEIN